MYLLNSCGQHYKKLEPLMSDRLLWSTTTSWHFAWLLAEGLAVLHVSQRRGEFLKLTSMDLIIYRFKFRNIVSVFF